ncbi:hypothetical protein EAS61_01330 [Bradyrhizobium zhanjiangense]|uniref:Uncharacterized protein n=1 Tax=Bradyrhizobium zhanjiangense TaxID=1325107 RepID=A0A4V1KXR5_9BRAD|nr:hypothetical protein EAS61_01330 [Bradyrhizobium zhanjiangense]
MVKELLHARIITGRVMSSVVGVCAKRFHITDVMPAKAGIQYAAASRFRHCRLGVLDARLSRAMTLSVWREAHATRSSLRGALATKQSRIAPRKDSGSLRGACHRAALRADPLGSQ